ncbi:MAG TPA: MFS transporter [Verrucomicrobiae bacterium]|nr:MFS transporter [Verrucomicrobiae bacterium]
MSKGSTTTTTRHASLLARVPFYYGWVVMAIAALAMVGTLPGRTQGLGLITESLLKDLNLDRVTFAQMNLWATLIGSLFCLGFGRLQDQLGSRVVLTVLALSLGGVVLAMSATASVTMLFVLLTLTRGFGQSALSITSLTLVGQWFNRRLNLAMAIYSVVLSMGFMAAFPIIGGAVQQHGWRAPWATVGWCLILGLAPIGLLLVRRGPESIGLEMESGSTSRETASTQDFTWLNALRTPAFWIFALASSTYNLVASGIGLFNESVLAERGFEPGIYHRSLVITALTSLIGNFLGGWLAEKWSVQRLMAIAMGLLAGALLGLPWLRAVWQVDIFAVVMGLAGGFVIVIFFSFWARTYGRAQLGRIQGTAQMLTVLASALGPLVLAKCHEWTDSYVTVFYVVATVVLVLGLAAWFVPLPRRLKERVTFSPE